MAYDVELNRFSSRRFEKYEVDRSIVERFERQVAEFPDRLAVNSGEQELTYAQLNQLANQVARLLLSERGGEEEPIALLLEQTHLLIATLLGVLKAGKIYVPFDPSLPLTRLAYLREDSQAALLLTNAKNISLARALFQPSALLNLDEVDPRGLATNPGLAIAPETLCYLLYTSGSTGQPKGVPQSHRNVLVDIRRQTLDLQINPDDRFALLFSCSFSASVSPIFGALLNGAALFLLDLQRDGLMNCAQWLAHNGITICDISVTAFRQLAGTLSDANHFPKLRLISLGGETVSAKDVELYQAHFSPNCVLQNALGTTETRIIAQYFIDAHTRLKGDTVAVGYAVEDKEVLLLDEDGYLVDHKAILLANDGEQEVGAGSIGEIVVRSKFLAPGYWNDPELTAEKFKSDPRDPDKRLYYTGDLALRLPDGCLIHKGRKDFRVKIRGFRVDLVEVEKALRSYEAVTEAVVTSTRSHDPELIAYYTCGKNQNPTVSDLRTHLGNILAGYITPTHFIKLDAIPLTPNGKFDREALPAPDTKRPKLNNLYAAAQDDLEAKLVAIWEQVIGKRPIGIDDDFFDLGGHSVLAARLFTRMDESIGRLLPLSILLTTPTIRLLAQQFRNPSDPIVASPLVTFRNTGNLLPIFAVPGVYGNVVGLAELCRELGPDQPFYALQSVGLDGREMPLQTVEEIAARYTDEIKKAFPRGPYTLLGACFGSGVTCEMAHQLLKLGDDIHFLGLLDPIGIALNESDQEASPPRGGENPLRSFLRARWQLYSEEFKNAEGPERLKFITNKIRSVSRAVFKKHAFSGVRREIHQLAVLNASKIAASNYRHKPLRGRLRAFEIFLSAHPRHKIIMNFNWQVIWDGDISIWHSPGRDSGDMLTGANARTLARLLSERLKQLAC